jgi:hypothetical protein
VSSGGPLARVKFSIGDRVERVVFAGSRPRGTVVRIIQDDPQVVAVSWDSDVVRVVTAERAPRLRLIPTEQNPGQRC